MTVAVPPSFGWGRSGHRITALVAEHYLTPDARAAVAELLHGQSMGDVASWADDERTAHAETAPWHFVDIPGDATTFDRQRDCPKAPDPKSPWRDCVTDRILYFEGRLGDETLSPEERTIALKFLIHLIGDVHQPLHAMGDHRGGNDIHVTYMGSRQCGTSVCNLHEVWDVALIESRKMNDKQYAEYLFGQITEKHWDKLAGRRADLVGECIAPLRGGCDSSRWCDLDW